MHVTVLHWSTDISLYELHRYGFPASVPVPELEVGVDRKVELPCLEPTISNLCQT